MPSPTTYRMISARFSPAVELARWLFGRYGIAVREEAHAPVLHRLAALAAGGGAELPVIVTPDGTVWDGARQTLDGVDALSPVGRKLFGETSCERAANQAFLEEILAGLLTPVSRFVYAPLLPHKRALLATVTHRAPAWERAVVSLCYPLWRILMVRRLGATPQLLAEAPAKIEAALASVEAELARRGAPFLGGAEPNGLDITFAALAGPLVFPRNYGARLPAVEDLPDALRRFVISTRARTAGDLVLRTYDAARFAKSSA